jgi:Tfp pilus assembly protein PilF
MRVGRLRRASTAILLIVLSTYAFAQSRPTIRHHREVVDDTPPEIALAEDDIQKNNFTSAEPLLKKALDKDPKNYQAW